MKMRDIFKLLKQNPDLRPTMKPAPGQTAAQRRKEIKERYKQYQKLGGG